MSRGLHRLIGVGLGWLAGTGWQLQAAVLRPGLAWAVAFGAVAAAVLGWHGRRRLARSGEVLLLVGLAAAAAWSVTTWRAAERLDDRLAPALEGVTLQLGGTVRGLPQRATDAVRFDFEPEPRLPGLPSRLRLGWYAAPGGVLPALRPGERWGLSVRLKQVHGLANPSGFDQELQWFEQGIGATGSVRQGHRLGGPDGEWVARLRAQVRDAIFAHVPDPSAAGLLAALSIGDQAAIARADWAVFRTTGIAHLVAISGMHVTMFAWLAAALLRRAWPRLGRLPLACPAPVAARLGGVLAATAYALLAGWGVPAQRTVWMLAAAALLRSRAQRWPWPAVLGAAGLTVVLLDPWALLQPGFWLSFVAVAVLMADGAPARAGMTGWLLAALRTQGLVTLALAPLGLLFFQQVSLVGLLANLAAIPLVSFVITPLALAGVVWPVAWTLAAQGIAAGIAGLEQLCRWPWAAWHAPVAPAPLWGLAFIGLAAVALPLPRRLRVFGAVAMLPVFLHVPARPAPGEFELLAADVGQGNAVLLRTAGHDLLYDTGPRYGPHGDAGERVLVPLLHVLGVRQLDLLVLSHRDADHVGGAESVLTGVPTRRLQSSLEPGHPLRARVPHQPCATGQAWQWDGVRFEFLHPSAEFLRDNLARAGHTNARSCVLRVQSRGRAALLAGDIEALQELTLVESQGTALQADVLLVPHHGSRTSSTPVFLDQVHPKWALVQAGYRNRFGHPAPTVQARYEARGIAFVRTDGCGAWHWDSARGSTWCERSRAPRYWHAPHTITPAQDGESAPEVVWP